MYVWFDAGDTHACKQLGGLEREAEASLKRFSSLPSSSFVTIRFVDGETIVKMSPEARSLRSNNLVIYVSLYSSTTFLGDVRL